MWKEYKESDVLQNGYYLVAKRYFLKYDPTIYCQNKIFYYYQKGTLIEARGIETEQVILKMPEGQIGWQEFEIPENGFYKQQGQTYVKVKGVTHYRNDFLALPSSIYERDMNEYERDYEAYLKAYFEGKTIEYETQVTKENDEGRCTWKEYNENEVLENKYYMVAKKKFVYDEPTVYCSNAVAHYYKKGTWVLAKSIFAKEVGLLSSQGIERIEIPENGFYTFFKDSYYIVYGVTHYSDAFLDLPDSLYEKNMTQCRREIEAKKLGKFLYEK